MKRIKWLLAAACVAFIVVAYVLFLSMQGQPFRMVIEPQDSGALVRFIYPDKNAVSPDFPIALTVEGRHEIVLDSPEVELPVGTIEFADHTLLPGRFTIRIDQTTYDVMSDRIEVDGKIVKWRQQ